MALGIFELIIIGGIVLAILYFLPKKIPELARSLRQAKKELEGKEK